MAGITVQDYANVNGDGTLAVTGQVEADEGVAATLTLAVVDGLVIGTGTLGVTGTGEPQNFQADVAAVDGPWPYGTAVVAATLVADDVQIAYATQDVTVYTG